MSRRDAPGGQTSGDVPASASEASVPTLTRQVRAAKHLSPALKRYWLTLLPHLLEGDRRRLASILRGDAP
jgi:hypothetical protein